MATHVNLIEEYRRVKSYIVVWLNWNNWFGLTYICKLDVCIYGDIDGILIEGLVCNLSWNNWFFFYQGTIGLEQLAWHDI